MAHPFAEMDLTDIVPRLARRELEGWAPQSEPQLLALLCPAYEVLYGGAAGGGKTDFALADHLRDALTYPHYKGVLFRRTYPELGEVIERARWFFPVACPEVTCRDGGKEWRFPLGGRLLFRHLNDYQRATQAQRSNEYSKVTFEELTTFEERQYLYLMTRARSSKGVPITIRATTNPGGLGHAWVFKRWGPWLDPKYLDHAGNPLQAEPGEILWFIPGPKKEDIWVPEGTPGSLSRTFIPAKLEDNQMLMRSDPSYEIRLNSQDPLTREQLRNGNWLAKPSPKTFFNREWAPLVDSPPADVRMVRGWDRASTPEEAITGSEDPDYTAGVLVGYSDSTQLFYIMDVEHGRWGPGGVKATVHSNATTDGWGVEQCLPCDPASAGVFEAEQWQSTLTGFVVNTDRQGGNKGDRAKVWSAQFAPAPGQMYGRFRIVKGPWNEPYLSELEDFTGIEKKGVHDDMVDATGYAFRRLVDGGGGGSALTREDRMRVRGEKDRQHERERERKSPGHDWGYQKRDEKRGGKRWRS